MGQVLHEAPHPALQAVEVELGRAGADGVVLAAHRHQPAVDLPEAAHVAGRKQPQVPARGVLEGERGQPSHLVEAPAEAVWT